MGRFLFSGASLACALVFAVASLDAAETNTPAKPDASAVGVRQTRVASMMQELDQRFLALAKSLEKTEPERAERLIKAYEESKTALIEPRMRQIVQMLDAAQLDNAGQEETKILEDVRKLIAILLKESEEREKDREEIDRLKKWHQQISMMVRDEQAQKAESRKLDQTKEALDTLAKQIAAVEELLKREKDILRQTVLTAAEGVTGLTQLAVNQELIRKDTEFVNAEITKARQAAESSGAPGKPTAASDMPPGPGQKPLADAVKQQQAAEQNLAATQAKTARAAEEQAVKDLEKALEELKKEEERLKSPPPDALDKLADKQEALAKKTEALNNQVAKAGQAGKPGDGACSACSKCLGGACQSMASASSSLKKKSPGAASAEQKKAEDQLNEAKKEVEKRLAELGEKPEDEAIERLEAIFGEMLARQQPATTQTAQFHQERQGAEGELRRAERITIRRLSQEESELAALAEKAQNLIEEDGSTVSFPVVVSDMKESLLQISNRIEKQDTAAETQAMQKDVEKTLEELIEALKIAKKGGGGAGQGGGNCKPALLPCTAELKLLRQLQLRINRRTVDFQNNRPQGELDAAKQAEVKRIGGLQKNVSGMVKEIISRQQEASGGGLQFPGSDLLNLPQ
ncbi:MAG TPA: hypothetical protein VM452_12140 [Caulifigura sp.]|nr:hypothetical protein [Caulifigura sp.]